jgi:hypothetical protein
LWVSLTGKNLHLNFTPGSNTIFINCLKHGNAAWWCLGCCGFFTCLSGWLVCWYTNLSKSTTEVACISRMYPRFPFYSSLSDPSKSRCSR